MSQTTLAGDPSSQLAKNSAETQASFQIGNEVGKIAQTIYDPKGKGVVFDPCVEGYDEVVARTAKLIESPRPLFEAGFTAGGARAYVDVMMPLRRKGRLVWRMVEVKSSSEVKATYRDDIAVQTFIAQAAGVPLDSVALAHIDNQWVYPGGGEYQGLLKEVDLTQEAFGRKEEVKEWIAEAQVVANKRKEPEIDTGSHCSKPYPCAFLDYCQRDVVSEKYPVTCLRGSKNKALNHWIEVEGIRDLRKIPNECLNPKHLRIKTHTLAETVYFDKTGAEAALAPHKLPAYFLDFETIGLAVPIWKGIRPFQAIPFQFSLHRLSRTGKLTHQAFLDLSGQDPARKIAEALITACGEQGPVFVYSSYENTQIRKLAERFPKLSRQLLAINERLVDLLSIVSEHYYHPDQHGRWGIKSVLPTIAPDLRYDELDGVQNGDMAMDAYREAIHPATSKARKDEIERQLLAYCFLDSIAMARVWQHFTGRSNSGV